MAERIYPDGIRQNYLANTYCEMAMESYYRAMTFRDIIEESGYSWDCCDKFDSLKKSVICTIVFSAMTVEAFLNDYAATCLGDEFFSKFVDRFRPLDKLEFIATLIFRKDIDKSKSYYSRLTTLFRGRNLYVHSKSEQAQFQGYTLEQMQEIEEIFNSGEFEIEVPLLDKNEIEDTMKRGIDALKAVRDMAIYFDENDSNIFAVKKLFPSPYMILISSKDVEYRLPILHLLEIKVDKL